MLPDASDAARGSSHAAVVQGTSVPISIPSLNRWKLGADGSDAAQQGVPGEDSQQAGVAPQPVPYYPATFVPPHQLSQREDFMFSFTGESPGVALKRSKLRTRNAILKSTGFLEPEARTVASIGAQERQRVMLSLTGGLSQALQGAAVL